MSDDEKKYFFEFIGSGISIKLDGCSCLMALVLIAGAVAFVIALVESGG